MEKNKVTSINDLIPSEFYLSQNYPNPFKDKTSIKYCLSEKTKVELTILNSNGEKVEELINKVQNAGTYETLFDSQDLKPGVYYYQLKAVDPKSGTRQFFDKTKQMVLQR
jgi:hypothetical protein